MHNSAAAGEYAGPTAITRGSARVLSDNADKLIEKRAALFFSAALKQRTLTR